jgi:hypothetical protein
VCLIGDLFFCIPSDTAGAQVLQTQEVVHRCLQLCCSASLHMVYQYVGFHVLTAASMKFRVFWDVALCSHIEVD